VYVIEEARSKGRGWRGDSYRHAEVGSAGGKITKTRYGREFYQKIGKKGGKVSSGRVRHPTIAHSVLPKESK
jgi:general stress protein YciG